MITPSWKDLHFPHYARIRYGQEDMAVWTKPVSLTFIHFSCSCSKENVSITFFVLSGVIYSSPSHQQSVFSSEISIQTQISSILYIGSASAVLRLFLDVTKWLLFFSYWPKSVFFFKNSEKIQVTKNLKNNYSSAEYAHHLLQVNTLLLHR